MLETIHYSLFDNFALMGRVVNRMFVSLQQDCISHSTSNSVRDRGPMYGE